MDIVIYAAGEIHSDWRVALRDHLQAAGVDAELVGVKRDVIGGP